MAVFRVEKSRDYSVMANFHFRDRNLSWKAKGILSNMLSLPDDWDYSLAGLEKLAKDGETSTRSAIKELELAGYLERKPVREKGKIVDWEYIIFEKPQLENQFVEEPVVENPQLENQRQYNTNQSSTNKQSTNQSSTKDKENINNEFEELWKMYPNKKGKPNALKAYQKARKSGIAFETVKQGLENYIKHCEANKTETQFIKHGSTWFNQQCWDDEYTLNKQQKPADGAYEIDRLLGTVL